MKKKVKKQHFRKGYLKAYSMSEILVVLCIIGILIYLVVPNQTAVVSSAKAIEAQNMLSMVHGLEKSHFYRHSKYTSDFDALGFEEALTIDKGGQAVYKIEIVEASLNTFKVTATALQDFDGDGIYNTWQIDQDRQLKEIVKD
ncbi:type IV pilin protein [Seonamhaeicola aphaedonensis]|uniref:Type II secretion system protein G (GspG) n=1 Tax=Seonamhaeicola aphaedonensis TaxID=1461338 RepID=A0A3D9H830_9FLAO|nr:prepilin-type N-terminal cleavage/methylation domain-containing protein [Seonamhaeicola aphaedonensis]RED45650.1 type II secretion system protein G (GspG) [Seonamhaeicola aphaedonensis]